MSFINKGPSSKNMNMTNESSEESGWTKYFEDFFDNHNIDDKKSSISLSGVDRSSSSLVSDAASLAAEKQLADSAKAEEDGNRLIFKKRKKIKTTSVDDALEDTASSPINSPKVLCQNQLSKAKQKAEIDLYQEKRNTPGERDERKEVGLNEGDSDCTELKKKGLCLVPLSMVMDYIG